MTAAVVVAAVAAEVECVLHVVVVAVLAWKDAVWSGGVASERGGVHWLRCGCEWHEALKVW